MEYGIGNCRRPFGPDHYSDSRLVNLNHPAVIYNKQHHIGAQAGWTRRFAPRLCIGRYEPIGGNRWK
jgi:hypothetical protein